MKKTGLIILVILLLGISITVIVLDMRSSGTRFGSGNQNLNDIDKLAKVDPALIGYTEVRNYNIGTDSPYAIAYRDQKIYLAESRFIRIFNLKGEQLAGIRLPYQATCIEITSDGKIITGFKDRLGLFNEAGEELWITDIINERAYITAVANKGQLVFTADAGNKVVQRFDISGKFLGSFEGKTGKDAFTGFIVPSGYFDLKVNNTGELWVVDPGKHAFENYTDEGDLRGSWENSSLDIDGFSGCCNPAHLAFLPDGSFVTSEKLIVRIKVHKPSGELVSVVAAPDKFKANGIAPDIAADEHGNIYALDFDRKIIRVFAPK
jgi:hypothetical protein